jgi:hypothetical protein
MYNEMLKAIHIYEISNKNAFLWQFNELEPSAALQKTPLRKKLI